MKQDKHGFVNQGFLSAGDGVSPIGNPDAGPLSRWTPDLVAAQTNEL